LTTEDIAMMTDGQREIFFEGMRVGAEIERKQILESVKDIPEAIARLKKGKNEKA
jgi:hypothetical protein